MTAVIASIIWSFAAEGLAHGLSKTAHSPGLVSAFVRKFRSFSAQVCCSIFCPSLFTNYVVISVESSRDAEARVMKASVLARDAERKALKAQVNPHFLFNSLNSISALTSSDPAKAREMCILLGDFLRRTLGLGEKAAIV